MEITPKMVKELRDRTTVGMMDCKKALQETAGDMEAAIKVLREKGLSSAAKRAHKEAKEGVIFSYIHSNSKLGVLVEINCETDFVARTDDFQELGRDVAMQVAAANPLVVSREDVLEADLERERDIFKNQALKSGKPEKIIDKIIEGKIEKFYSENVLLEQAFIKDDKVVVGDRLKEVIGKLGENMVIKRFARFQLGEETS